MTTYTITVRRGRQVDARRVGAGESVEVEGFDPGEHKIDDVLAYLTDHPDEVEGVLDAERARGNAARPTLIAQLLGMLNPDTDESEESDDEADDDDETGDAGDDPGDDG